MPRLTEFETQLRNQILKNWKNYRKKRIDLATAREKKQFDIAGKYICVENVSSADAAATIRINEKENDELVLVDGLEIKTLFKHFFITNAVQADEWIDLIIGADFEYKKKVEAKSLEYVFRGDPVGYDFNSGHFTLDNAWHDLDLSGIIPAGTKLVQFQGFFRTDPAFLFGSFRKNGQVNSGNVVMVITQTLSFIAYDFFIQPDDDGVIEYKFSVGSWYALNLVIKGWFI